MIRLVETLHRSVTAMTRLQKMVILLIIDAGLIPISLWLTTIVAGGILKTAMLEQTNAFIILAGVMASAGIVFSFVLGLPRIKLNAYEQNGIQRTAAFSVLTGIVGLIAMDSLIEGTTLGRNMVVFTMILVILSVGSRVVMRSALIFVYRGGQVRQRVLIYGAGQTGVQLATALQTDNSIMAVAFVDDNKTLHNIMVAGLPVFPPVRLEALIEKHQIERVVLAMPSISRPKQARLARRLADTKCEVSTLPSFASLVGEGKLIDRIQPVDPSDYLGRDGLECELGGLCGIYAGRTVMITGAGGSIGSELSRQVLACKPPRLVMFELSEFALYQLERELVDLGVDRSETEIIPVLGSVTDAATVRHVIETYDVEIILHAAAYKHVPLVEKNRLAGLKNNVIGTRIVAEAARDIDRVSHFILISTDKAVHPRNVMGASKRLAELLVQDLASRSLDTRFGIVRFGNVLGSSGSVVPLFEEQIARGGPVTLTHHEVSRYFMTMTEAARLVLMAGNYAGQNDGQGDVFLLDMGAPVPIRHLARQMIEAAGYTVCDEARPDGDMEIVITGLRPGEKIHEKLIMNGYAQRDTAHPKIKRIEEVRLSQVEAATALRDLKRSIDDFDDQAALNVIQRWVGLNSTISQMTTADKPVRLIEQGT